MKTLFAGLFLLVGCCLAQFSQAQVTVINDDLNCTYRVVIGWNDDGPPDCTPTTFTVMNVAPKSTVHMSAPSPGMQDVSAKVILFSAPVPRPRVDLKGPECGGPSSEPLGNEACGTAIITYNDHRVTIDP